MTSTYWFGRQPPADAVRAWGARAIYQNLAIDLLWDRQSWRPDEKPPAEFEQWVNKIGLPWLRQAVKDEWLPGDSDRVLTLDEGQYVMEACPNRSFGYLYICAYERVVPVTAP